MLKPMNLQLFAEPGDPVPTSESTPAAGKTYSEDYVTALRGESANYRTRAKSYEGALRTVLGLKDGEELGDLNARLSAYQQNQTKAAVRRPGGGKQSACSPRQSRTLEGYDHKLLEKLIDLSNVKVSEDGTVTGLKEAAERPRRISLPCVKHPRNFQGAQRVPLKTWTTGRTVRTPL